MRIKSFLEIIEPEQETERQARAKAELDAAMAYIKVYKKNRVNDPYQDYIDYFPDEDALEEY